ncbi:uncharacterized protein LOC141588488 [Silene latifolia]|uniref:uncharacterized protein LOC141588488 n=1 Tax=Silene latifolia TaxID=37657 RepID=UPI003D77204D
MPPKRIALYASVENMSVDEIVKMLEHQDALTEALKKFGKDKEAGVDFAKMSINIARFNPKEYMGTGAPILLDNWHREMENILNVGISAIPWVAEYYPKFNEKSRYAEDMRLNQENLALRFEKGLPTILPITGEEEEPMVKASNPKKTKVTRIGCKARIFFRFVIKEIDQVQVPLFVVDQFHAAHNHRLSPLKYREFQKKCRNLALQHKQTIVDNCKVNIGPTSTFRSVKEYVDGYENIGASLTEFKNFGREIKCFIGLKDAQMFVDRLEHLHETRKSCFPLFIHAHRYCMWHIMKKLPKSEFQLEDNTWLQYLFSIWQRWIPAYYRDIPLGCLLRTTQRSESANNFFKRFENPHGTLVEFWMRFQSAMDQQRYTQKSLDRDSDHSLPQTKTLLSLEVHASTVYTHALFYEFQQQCVDSLNSCSAGDSSREGSTRFLEVEDSIFNKSYTVAFNPSTFDATCSCKLFERKGYICKHIIWILSGKGIKKIPDKYLLSRWTKNTKKMPLYDAHGQLLDDFTSSDVTKLQISTVWSEFYSTLTLLKSLPENHINELTSLLKTFRQNFKSIFEKLTKHQELEMLLGVKSSSEVRILPPVQSKNKGTGKRLMSKKDRSLQRHKSRKDFAIIISSLVDSD